MKPRKHSFNEGVLLLFRLSPFCYIVSRNFIVTSLLERGLTKSAEDLKKDIEISKSDILKDLTALYGDLGTIDSLLS